MFELQKLECIHIWQGMRESNSQQWFWRPLLYHLTNPLCRQDITTISYAKRSFNIKLTDLDSNISKNIKYTSKIRH